ncbi:MAG: hypothetical protein GY816_03550 [Cytophagales bacterium]|nr:hypothetical protein [Cytophagales bacterium]
MKPYLTISLLLLCLVGFSQFKTNVTATGKHKYLMGQPKRTKAQIVARKQQLETYRNYMDIKEQYAFSYDSAKVIYIDSIYTQKKYPITYKTDSIWSGVPVAMRYDFKPTPDSLWISQKLLASGDLPPESTRYLANPPNRPSVGQVKAQIQDYKNALKYRKNFEAAYDSGKVVYLDSIYTSRGTNTKYKGTSGHWKTLPDEMRYPYAKTDSLIVTERILNSGVFPPEAVYYLTNPPPNPKTMLLDRVDSTAYGEEKLKELMSAYSDDLPDQGEFSLVSAFGNPSNPNMLSPDEAQEMMTMTDPEEFAKQQAENRLLKKKFSSMPDQRNPDAGVKRNSLEDAPFKNRIYVGGQLNLESTDPMIIDFGLQLGYWINKNWLAGVGMTMREQFGNKPNLKGDSWGNSLFTRYNLPIGFFAYSELQRSIKESLFKKEVDVLIPSEWEEAYLAGIGKEFKVGFVNMTLNVLYDFNWRYNDIYSSPVTTRIGIQFSKKPKVGEKK